MTTTTRVHQLRTPLLWLAGLRARARRIPIAVLSVWQFFYLGRAYGEEIREGEGIAEVMIAGYVLGQAYKSAGPWLTAVGVAVLAIMLVVVGRTLTRD